MCIRDRTKRAVFEEFGGLDEQHCPNGFGDTLFCKQLTKRGYRMIHTPTASATHYESLSRGESIEDIELWDMSRLGLEIADLQHILVSKRQPMVYPLHATAADGGGRSPFLDKLVAKVKRSPLSLTVVEQVSKWIFALYSKLKK